MSTKPPTSACCSAVVPRQRTRGPRGCLGTSSQCQNQCTAQKLRRTTVQRTTRTPRKTWTLGTYCSCSTATTAAAAQMLHCRSGCRKRPIPVCARASARRALNLASALKCSRLPGVAASRLGILKRCTSLVYARITPASLARDLIPGRCFLSSHIDPIRARQLGSGVTLSWPRAWPGRLQHWGTTQGPFDGAARLPKRKLAAVATAETPLAPAHGRYTRNHCTCKSNGMKTQPKRPCNTAVCAPHTRYRWAILYTHAGLPSQGDKPTHTIHFTKHHCYISVLQCELRTMPYVAAANNSQQPASPLYTSHGTRANLLPNLEEHHTSVATRHGTYRGE